MVKIKGSQELHQYCIDQLLQHLKYIDEDPYEVAWVMHEGVWMPQGTTRRNSLCDLIIGHYGNEVTLAELKSTKNKRAKAKKQLYKGKEFVEAHLPSYELREMKYVWYTGGDPPYGYEII